MVAFQGYIIIDPETNLPTEDFIKRGFPILEGFATKLVLERKGSEKKGSERNTLISTGLIWEAVFVEILNRRDLSLLPPGWSIQPASWHDDTQLGTDMWLYGPDGEKVAVQFTTKN